MADRVGLLFFCLFLSGDQSFTAELPAYDENS